MTHDTTTTKDGDRTAKEVMETQVENVDEVLKLDADCIDHIIVSKYSSGDLELEVWLSNGELITLPFTGMDVLDRKKIDTLLNGKKEVKQ
jgi:hypothetical protein